MSPPLLYLSAGCFVFIFPLSIYLAFTSLLSVLSSLPCLLHQSIFSTLKFSQNSTWSFPSFQSILFAVLLLNSPSFLLLLIPPISYKRNPCAFIHYFCPPPHHLFITIFCHCSNQLFLLAPLLLQILHFPNLSSLQPHPKNFLSLKQGF